MQTRKKSIKILGHERQLLIALYMRWRIPIDQFESRPDDFKAFVHEWNRCSKRKDASGDLLHYMRSQRKRGLWVRFEGKHETAPPQPTFTAEETETLVNIFYDNVTLLESGSDVLAYDDEIAGLIAKEFLANTGRTVAPHELVAKLTALRKRGLLPKVRDIEKGQLPADIGFADIEDVS